MDRSGTSAYNWMGVTGSDFTSAEDRFNRSSTQEKTGTAF